MYTQRLPVLIFAILLPCSICELINPDDWYKGGNFYQIYPRSFKDSDGDGIGDLNGITSKLEHLKEIGVDGVWLSPIFKSPMKDFGYDISDYYQIQPEYGTMKDFEKLTAKCRSLGLKLILDYVPNHTSDQHEWFIKSVNKEPGYEDFYVWHPGKVNTTTGKRSPPSNWLSQFRFSAWQWNDKRQAYYLHQYAVQQPDLNHRNPKVVESMKAVMRFWLDKGAFGFRVDAIPNLFEIEPDARGILPDEPQSGKCSDPNDFCYLNHIYTNNLNKSFGMVYQWREFLENYRNENGGEARLLMTEPNDELEGMLRHFGDGKRNGSHIPFNFYLLGSANKRSKAADYKYFIETYMSKIPAGAEPNWVLGNHDRNRIASRLGEKRVDLYNILLKTLPGITVTYNGEEIGMTDVIISWEDSVDPMACNKNEPTYYTVSRDPARTPLQWNDSRNAGFTKGKKPWLPISTNYKCVNVKTQRAQPRSHLNVYKRLVKLRKEASLIDASYESALFGEIYAYKRQSASQKPIVIALNFGEAWQTIDLSSKFGLPEKLKVVVASIESQYTEGQILDGTQLTIPSDVGIVLTTNL